MLLRRRNGPGERPSSRLEAADAGRACEHVSDAWTNGDTRVADARLIALACWSMESSLLYFGSALSTTQALAGDIMRCGSSIGVCWWLGVLPASGRRRATPLGCVVGVVPPRAVAAGQSREHAARGVPEYTCCVYQRGGLAMVVQVASLEGARRACWACMAGDPHEDDGDGDACVHRRWRPAATDRLFSSTK